jgi:hypothetical protein
MRDETQSIRPPKGFVSIAEQRWQALCNRTDGNPKSRELRRLGWRGMLMWYVNMERYRGRRDVAAGLLAKIR